MKNSSKSSTPSAAWDQLPDEPNVAYARFLIYRNLGPARSLQSAYQVASKGVKRRRAPGQWHDDSAIYHWVDRAAAWDVHHLAQAGREAVIAFVNTLNEVAHKTLAALSEARVKPSTWSEVINALNTLGNFIPGETVAALQADAQAGKMPGLGGR